MHDAAGHCVPLLQMQTNPTRRARGEGERNRGHRRAHRLTPATGVACPPPAALPRAVGGLTGRELMVLIAARACAGSANSAMA
jgi:hypothetical protein